MFKKQEKRNEVRIMLCKLILIFVLGGSLFSGIVKKAAAEEGGLVARDDFKICQEWALPTIMGRTFWNLLPPSDYASPPAKIKEAEPMVKQAAIRYPLGYLTQQETSSYFLREIEVYEKGEKGVRRNRI